ncbi:unnamed protein product [Auanema sp. JU1783]|nr:unnamed protein product [Auanema sp. JU1783]
MLPDCGVGSAAPACWYNSVVVEEDNSPNVRNDNSSPVECVSAETPDEDIYEDDHIGNEKSQAHIEKLSKPKKSCLTDKPFPARLHQKKKVVAFGRTVNYSQTIEASSKRDHHHKPTMNKVIENKENKPPPTAVRALCAKPEQSKRKSSENEKADQDDSSDLLAMKEQLKRNEEKNEVLFAQLFKKLEELTTVARPEPIRTEEIRRPLAEKKPEKQLEYDPGFISELTNYCKNMETKLGYGSPQPTDDYTRSTHRPTLTRSAVATTRERNEVTRNERSGAFVTERMTVERSFMSPGGEPFSVDSRRFLGNRGLIGGAERNNTSPPRIKSIQNAPQSYYQPGYSVAYVPQRSVVESSDDENCGTVLQLTDEQYEKQCAAREAKLRNTPFVSELDDNKVRGKAPEDRIRREVQRQLEEKRRRRDEILKK